MADITPTIAEFNPHTTTNNNRNILETLETVESLQAKIADLEQRLAANVSGGKLAKIETSNGQIKSAKQIQDDVDEFLEEQALAVLRSKRFSEEFAQRELVSHARPDGSLHWQPRSESNPPLFASDAAVTELVGGLSKFAALTPAQKAQAKDIRESDLRDHRVEKYFGSGTSAAAHELGQKNYPLYRALRQVAQKRGLI